jgi:hypothetical protein
MATKNNITGDEIKSKTLSKQGRDNWEIAFSRKTAIEWAELDGIATLDPKTFENGDGITVKTPISYTEYRKQISSVKVGKKKNIN